MAIGYLVTGTNNKRRALSHLKELSSAPTNTDPVYGIIHNWLNKGVHQDWVKTQIRDEVRKGFGRDFTLGDILKASSIFLQSGKIRLPGGVQEPDLVKDLIAHDFYKVEVGELRTVLSPGYTVASSYTGSLRVRSYSECRPVPKPASETPPVIATSTALCPSTRTAPNQISTPLYVEVRARAGVPCSVSAPAYYDFSS